MSLRKGKKIIAGLPNMATESKSGLMSSSDKVKLDSLDPSNFVTKNDPITAGTHTKITYDTKGLVTGGSDLTASDIPDLSSTYYLASNPSGYITSSAITGKENTSNKVTSISSSSTNTQYPSAKCVYDIVGNIEATLQAIRGV